MTTLDNVLTVFERHRLPDSNISRWHDGGREALAAKLGQFVNAGKRIDFLMLGYPFKSPNHIHKTLGPRPDMAEEVSIRHFADFGDDIRAVYTPGMHLTILSDGYMFNDVFGVTSYDTDLYHDEVLGMVRDIKAPVELLTLADLYPKLCTSLAVDEMIRHFGLDEAEVERRILFDPNVNWLYRAFIRFMEEELMNRTFSSKNARHVAAKRLARVMMTRNECYSNYAEKEMSLNIRLSMHATTNDKKWGIQLVPGSCAKHSPWHCALVVGRDSGFATMHKIDAENAGYQLVYKANQPYYYAQTI